MKTIGLMALVSAAAVAALGPSPTNAQSAGAVILTPYVGVYTPAADIGKLVMTSGGVTAVGTLKHQSAVAFGTNASYWLSDRLAIEGGLVYSSSDVKGSAFASSGGISAGQNFKDHANVWLGSTKLMFQLMPRESDFNLRFGIGPAIITRNGSAYKDSEGTVTGLTDVGAAMSLCTRFNLSSKVGLRLRAEDYMYRAQLGYNSAVNPADNIRLDARTQNDFVFSAGIQFFLNR